MSEEHEIRRVSEEELMMIASKGWRPNARKIWLPKSVRRSYLVRKIFGGG